MKINDDGVVDDEDQDEDLQVQVTLQEILEVTLQEKESMVLQ